ncbi:MAG: radical SAM protein [Acidobacteria bacterium]|nr:radical SAM protein [Acidobacteriota bacterium]
MRVVLADLKGTDGFVTKDTVVGGYGSRLTPFTRVTAACYEVKRRFLLALSPQMGQLAAIAAQFGHEVVVTRDECVDGDVTVVLSSLVDYRHETAWADAMRARGVRTGFVGLAASKLPHLFTNHADFIITGEPEEAFTRLAGGERLDGLCASREVADLDALPFPRWDLLARAGRLPGLGLPLVMRPLHGGYPILASRSCPEFCTYCPIRILASYRTRSIQSIVDELEQLCDRYERPHVIFRDPLFSQDRDRCLALSDQIVSRGLRLTFECETRLDRLDEPLIDRLYAAGLRTICFGVESVSADTLRKVARRPIPPPHQAAIVRHCRRRRIATAAQYVLGFVQDDWSSIAATIDYAIELGSTFAQFKLLTPYPGTPLWKQLESRVYERDWQKFDGFTPTFTHPNLTADELRFLLGAAYSRFYMRPSFLTNYLGVSGAWVRDVVGSLDRRVSRRHARAEIAKMSKPVTC